MRGWNITCAWVYQRCPPFFLEKSTSFLFSTRPLLSSYFLNLPCHVPVWGSTKRPISTSCFGLERPSKKHQPTHFDSAVKRMPKSWRDLNVISVTNNYLLEYAREGIINSQYDRHVVTWWSGWIVYIFDFLIRMKCMITHERIVFSIFSFTRHTCNIWCQNFPCLLPLCPTAKNFPIWIHMYLFCFLVFLRILIC